VKRRAFLTQGLIGTAAATSLAAPAIAQGAPEIRWRLTSSYPKSLDAIYGAAEYVAKRVAAMTGDKFQIRVFASGEIVPGLQVLDAVQNGTVEAGHTPSYFYVGKDPAFTFDTAVPFGLNTRQHMAWMANGGLELVREFLRDYGVTSFPAGHTGAQMGGWFRKEIKSVEDLNGLKFRIGGFAGKVLTKVGVIPQQIAGGEIYPALEKGVIDGAEWIGPYDDEKLGFNKVAKYYYYPGWWEGSSQVSIMVGLKAWEALPAPYKAVFESACAEANTWMLAKYDGANPAALKRLVASGTQLRAFPRDVMQLCHKAATELYEETAAGNPRFAKLYASWKDFLEEELLWFRVCEYGYDNYMQMTRRT
jgi:TRAP-type mannitol/chloroaromatic compound transport system substrate-binding protein